MRHFARPFAAIPVYLFLAIPGMAQTDQAPTLSGEIQVPSERLVHGYVVALEDSATHRDFATADVETDGAFRFRNVPYGEYLLKVETYYGEVLHQDYVSVGSRTTPILVQLPTKKDARPPSEGVAVGRLQHPPAKKAYQAFLDAQKFSEVGRYAEAAKKLERAIEISPDYADAHSNLAAQYVRMGRNEEAVTEIGRAMEIAKPNAVDLSNLACAQSAMQHYGDALKSARAAVRIDPNNMSAHFILGALLARDRRTLPEGIEHLTMAAETSASARRTLEQAQAALTQATASQ